MRRPMTRTEFVQRIVSVDQCVAENVTLRAENKKLSNQNYQLRKVHEQLRHDYEELVEFIKGNRQ